MGGSSKDPNKAAMKLQKKQAKRLDAISLPELQEYMLQSPELVGLLDAEQLGDTALSDIRTDPRLKENQMKALQGLSERAEEGLTVEDKYAMDDLLEGVTNQEKSQRASIEQDMLRRGMDTSGLALASQLQSSQASANNARQRARDIALGASQSKQQALANLAQQSGQMEQADYGRQANIKTARDQIMRANAMNKQNVAATNLGARQSIANQKANIANQQSQVANQIAQQNFNNQISKVSGQGSVANNMSNIAANTPQGPSTMQTIGTIGGGIAGAYFGGPAGASAGASAGGALGGLFEDGGIVRKYNNGGLAFKDAWQQARDSHGGDGGQFDWNGKNYTTNATEEQKARELEALRSGQFEHDKMLADKEIDLPIENNMTEQQQDELYGKGVVSSGQMTEKELQDSRSGEGTDYSGMLSGLGSVAKSLAPKRAAKSLSLESMNIQAPQNAMGVVGPMSFDNPYAQARFEDGGLPSGVNDVKMKKYKPNYEDGTDFMSSGMGEIIDSGMNSYADDRVDAKVNDGEAVLNIPQQQRLMDMLRGEISPNELGDEDIVEGVPKDYRDELHDKIDNGEDSESKGFKKLLQMLGK